MPVKRKKQPAKSDAGAADSAKRSRQQIAADFRSELDAKTKANGGADPTWTTQHAPDASDTVCCGVDRVAADPHLLRDYGRIAIVTNQGCAADSKSAGELTANVIFKAAAQTTNARVVCVFGPQHGFGQTEQDNMIETADTSYTVHRYPPSIDGQPPSLLCYCASNKSASATTTAAASNGDSKSGDAGQCTTVPLYSLYGKTRIPSQAQLAQFDTFIVDLQDIGCRVYTFQYTLAYCLRATAEANKASASSASASAAGAARKRVIVLDRPNPCGLAEPHLLSADSKSAAAVWYSRVNGDRMTESLRTSFVGLYDLPFQYGMTLGELGQLFMARDGITQFVDYRVITCSGLKRRVATASASAGASTVSGAISADLYDSGRSGRGGVLFLPSPNMPSGNTARVFLSTVLLEATNISEGRGSTKPFNLFGAPFLQSHEFIRFIEVVRTAAETAAAGAASGATNLLHRRMLMERCRLSTAAGTPLVSLSGYQFRPTFNKFAGKICNAVLMTPLVRADGPTADEEEPNLYAFGVLICLYLVLYHPTEFEWRPPSAGYEYNFTEPAINLLLGIREYKEWFDQMRAASVKAVRGSTAWTSLVSSAVSDALNRLGQSWLDGQKAAAEAKQFWLY